MSKANKKEETPEDIAYSCIGVWIGRSFLPRDKCRLGNWFFKPDISCCVNCSPKKEVISSIKTDRLKPLPIQGERRFSTDCYSCYNYHAGIKIRLGRCVGSIYRRACPNHIKKEMS